MYQQLLLNHRAHFLPPIQRTALTKPCLLVSLNLNGQPKICQLDSRSFALAGQQKILRLENTGVSGHQSQKAPGQPTCTPPPVRVRFRSRGLKRYRPGQRPVRVRWRAGSDTGQAQPAGPRTGASRRVWSQSRIWEAVSDLTFGRQ
jgi:hypothetical protein